jgi:hypothetical protein
MRLRLYDKPKTNLCQENIMALLRKPKVQIRQEGPNYYRRRAFRIISTEGTLTKRPASSL